MHAHRPKRNWTLIVCIAILVVVTLNGFVAWWHYLVEAPAVQKIIAPAEAKGQYALLRPDIANLDVDTFLEQQKLAVINMRPLRDQLRALLNQSTTIGTYGVYVEDLQTGAWLGLSERDLFFPASLAKMPIVVAIYKKVQDGGLMLGQNIVITEKDIDARFGTLAYVEPGTEFTVEELIKYALVDSDNTAMRALLHQLTIDEIMEARLAMGLNWPKEKDDVTRASPREYANMFRSLYIASYLRRPFANQMLSLLADTPFDNQLVGGLPTNVRVSHKYGVTPDEESTHDCGIVYLEQKNYLICVMSKGAPVETADRMIAEISKETYEFMNK